MLVSDREAERAERQANLATLQQIAQLAHNNQGQGNQDNHGSTLKNFQNTNPPVFTKSEEPLDADDWLQTMENNLEVVGVEANEKVLFSTRRRCKSMVEQRSCNDWRTDDDFGGIQGQVQQNPCAT